MCLWVFSFFCDFIYWIGWGSSAWAEVSLYCMGAAIVGSLLAAVPGVIEYQSLKGRSRTIVVFHMTLNTAAVILFTVNLLLRGNGAIDLGASLVFSALILVLLTISGWLGGKPVYVPRPGAAGERQEKIRMGIDPAA